MKKQDLNRAIGQIDDHFLTLTEEELNKKRKIPWLRWVGAVAAVALIVTAAIPAVDSWRRSLILDGDGMERSITQPEPDSQPSPESYTEPQEPPVIIIPQMEVTLGGKDAEIADMLAFFIYNGSSYVEWGFGPGDPALKGEKLGTATGFIDEWTPAEGYVDGAGSICGDFYAVKGYSSDFLLCMEWDDHIEFFMNNNGLTLHEGRELFTDRMQLSDQMTVTAKTHHDWEVETMERVVLNDTAVQRLLEELNTAPFFYLDDLPHEGDYYDLSSHAKYHLFFGQEGGPTFELWLLEDGVVTVSGLHSVGVRISEELYNEFLEAMGHP